MHYVPILKWKSAEQRALKDLKEEDKKQITPLIELVMPKVSSIYKDREKKIKKTPEEMTNEMLQKFKEKRVKVIPKEILEFWGTAPILIDFSLLHDGEHTTQLKVDGMNAIIPDGIALGLSLTPVVGLNDDTEIRSAVCALAKKCGHGFCLRISASDLMDVAKLNEKITTFLGACGVDEKDIDLLIDVKAISEKAGVYLQYVSFTQQIKNLNKWRNFIFSSGAFPEDLSECKFGDPSFLSRFDWINWVEYFKNKSTELTRIPTFSDYTIRNPIFKESLQFYHSTTSIKYTLEDTWMVMKGKVREYELYLASANLLANSEHFSGEDFSAGDKFIAEKAKHYPAYMKNKKLKGTGGSEDWIYMGINHHLTLVAHRVANPA